MFKVQIQPKWTLHAADGRPLPPKLIELLLGVHATGSLAAACRELGLSYRYAWGLLQDSQSLFGAPLLRMARGRGARLTALGERLVWAEQRIAARLAPTPAPSLSASGSIRVWKFSPFCRARPPDTMIFALVSSGRSDLLISAPSKVDRPASPAPATASTTPAPPSRAALSNAVPRTVTTSLPAGAFTVAMALPA